MQNPSTGVGRPVVPVAAIKVSVIPVIGRLTDAAAAVPHDFAIAAIFRAIGIIVAQVPFAKHAGRVAGIGKNCPIVTSFSRNIERPMIVCQTPVRLVQ